MAKKNDWMKKEFEEAKRQSEGLPPWLRNAPKSSTDEHQDSVKEQ